MLSNSKAKWGNKTSRAPGSHERLLQCQSQPLLMNWTPVPIPCCCPEKTKPQTQKPTLTDAPAASLKFDYEARCGCISVSDPFFLYTKQICMGLKDLSAGNMLDIVSPVRYEKKPENSSGTCCAETMYVWTDMSACDRWKANRILENLHSEHSIGKHLF